MKSNDDQTIATEDTESTAIEVREEDLASDGGLGDFDESAVDEEAAADIEDSAGKEISMGLNWSVGAGRQSSETAVLAIRKIADVVLLLLISIALAIAVTVTLIVGASWGWNFVWNAIRG